MTLSLRSPAILCYLTLPACQATVNLGPLSASDTLNTSGGSTESQTAGTGTPDSTTPGDPSTSGPDSSGPGTADTSTDTGGPWETGATESDTTSGGSGGWDPLDENYVPEPPPGVHAISLALASGATFILLNTGEVKAWGNGTHGRLGYGNTNNIADPSKVGPIDLGFKARQVVASHLFACALPRPDDPKAGLAACWGFDAGGNLGRGKIDAKNPNIGDDETPAAAPLIELKAPIAKLAAGTGHVCALLETQEVGCWGLGGSGQLGYGDSENVGDDELPISKGTVDVGGPVADIAAGGDQTCAIRVDGTVMCWGALVSPETGQWVKIGDNELPSSQNPLDFGFQVRQLALGIEYLCALSTPEDGHRGKCIGTATYGKLGYGDLKNQPDPSKAADLSLPIEPVWIDAMHSHTCFASAEGETACMGWGADGILGYGSTENVGDDDTPLEWGKVITGGEVIRVYTGPTHTCGLFANGDINCWGSYYSNHGHPNYQHNVGDDEIPASVGLVKYL